jgi:hypothetical protein
MSLGARGHALLVLSLARIIAALLAVGLTDGGLAEPPLGPNQAEIDLKTFKVFKEDSGPVNYYTVVSEADGRMIRATYSLGLASVVLFAPVPDIARKRVTKVSWRWRVHTLPRDSNDCGPGFEDSAASVFIAFKSGLKLMALKYVWSTTGTPGTVCRSQRGWFFDRDTILVQVGGPLDVWKSFDVDPRAEFTKHFDVKPEDVPDFVAIGVMTDGDSSHSLAAADYADFVVQWSEGAAH